MSAPHIRFNDNDDDEYAPTDSDDELSDREKRLLDKARNRGPAFSDSEEEVLGVGSESDDDDNSDIALSDVEGQDEADDDGIPNIKAWGKNKKAYYSTDYVDPDYGGFQGKDATLAEIEEEEARTLQAELAKSMDDDDFALDFPMSAPEGDKMVDREVAETVKTDVSKLSKRQKIELLKKESPEFFGLVEDYEEKMQIAKDYLQPIVQMRKENRISTSKATEFVATYYELILNYTTNIVMYLLLKASGANIKKHPVIKRLYQFRQLTSQMDPVFNEVVKAQIELLFEREGEQDKPKLKKKTLKLLSALKKKTKELPVEEAPSKKLKRKEIESGDDVESKEVAGNGLVPDSDDSSDDDEAEQNNEDVADTEEKVDDDGRRGITYQMAKNKGLMPYRKKEQRNPRVKHRNKYRKAKIRRKGAVREVRRETSRYGGEVSGIKATVTKSVKLKS